MKTTEEYFDEIARQEAYREIGTLIVMETLFVYKLQSPDFLPKGFWGDFDVKIEYRNKSVTIKRNNKKLLVYAGWLHKEMRVVIFNLETNGEWTKDFRAICLNKILELTKTKTKLKLQLEANAIRMKEETFK